MKKTNTNQYTGYRAPGFRFRFHVQAIARPVLSLPLEMKELPEIRRLLDGESPLSVFNSHSIQAARKAFNELRKRFDFSYWAINEYYIPNRNDADQIIPLKLNTTQRYVIDILRKRYYNHQHARYVITKSCFPCGLTTCVQAYITWLQVYRCCNTSYTCSSSDINLNPLKTNLCRWLGRDVVPPEKWIYLPKAGDRALFNTFRSPDMSRGTNLGYVHLADMGKWKDPKGDLTCRTINASVSGVLLDYFTLVVFEGNVPKPKRFDPKRYQDFKVPFKARIERFSSLSSNPVFLNYVTRAVCPDPASPVVHIDLSDAYFPERQLQIPLMERHGHGARRSFFKD